MSTAAEIQAKMDALEADMDKFNGIVNGDDQASVLTDGGNVPSVAKFYNDALRNAPTTSRLTESWSALNALTGTVEGEGAVVLDADTGTHTDPVVGGTVANSGSFRWSASPVGWRRVGTTGLSTKSDRSVTDLRDLFPGRSLSGVTAAELAAFAAIRKLEFSGVPEGKVMLLKFLFWKDVGTRFNMTFQVADDASGTNAADACTLVVLNGGAAGSWAGFKDLELDEVSSSGIKASVTLNLTGLANLSLNTTPATAAVFQRRQVNPACFLGGGAFDATLLESVLGSSEVDATIVASVKTREALKPGSRMPFADNMDGSDLLRSLVKSVWVYGADPTHEYVVSQLNVTQFGSPTNLTRLQVEVTDVTDASIACSTRYQVGSGTVTFADFIADVPDTLKLTDFLLSDKTYVSAVVDIDWDAVTAYFANVGGATVSAAGIHPERVLSDEDINDYLDGDHWHQVIRCGAAETYTTLRAAVESTYSPITGSTLVKGSPICEFAHYHNRVLIDIVDDGEFDATGLYIPEWVEVRGNGMDRTFIRRENTDPEPLIEQRTTGKFFDCTTFSETSSEYCFHSDDFNRNAGGDKLQQNRIRQAYKRIKMVGGIGHNGWLFGNGMSSGQEIRFEDVIGEHLDAAATEPAFGFHNSGPTLSTPSLKASFKPAHVKMSGCGSPDQKPIELATLEPSSICTLTLIDCHFPGYIQVETSSGNEVNSDLASERNAWRIGGRHDGPWLRLDPVGENVLKTTAGQTPSGTAAAVLFGTTDELGRGEKWVGSPNNNSLGIRIGDCSSFNKTLTIGGETHTFNTDLRAVANATIISQINASITSYPVSIVAGENVLKTTAGQPVGGDMAWNLFGDVDATGRGSQLVGFSLGERLGDCSGTSKALTIGAQTHTFNTNLTAETNANIISAINASITSHPVSVVDIQLEWVPDAAPKRRVNNNTGSTIPKGRMVKLTSASTIALCGAGETVVDGWTHRDILDGDDGYMLLPRDVHQSYLDGASASTGEFGINASGQVDYAQANKVGRTLGGISRMYR